MGPQVHVQCQWPGFLKARGDELHCDHAEPVLSCVGALRAYGPVPLRQGHPGHWGQDAHRLHVLPDKDVQPGFIRRHGGEDVLTSRGWVWLLRTEELHEGGEDWRKRPRCRSSNGVNL